MRTTPATSIRTCGVRVPAPRKWVGMGNQEFRNGNGGMTMGMRMGIGIGIKGPTTKPTRSSVQRPPIADGGAPVCRTGRGLRTGRRAAFRTRHFAPAGVTSHGQLPHIMYAPASLNLTQSPVVRPPTTGLRLTASTARHADGPPPSPSYPTVCRWHKDGRYRGPSRFTGAATGTV